MTVTAAFAVTSNALSHYGQAGTIIVRQFAAQLGGVYLVMPACKNIFSSDPTSLTATFDEVTDGGLPVPDAAATIGFSSTGITGTDLAYYITSYDERTLTHSNPSAQSSSLSPSNQGILVTFADTNLNANARVTHRGVWRNTTASAVYHLVALVAVGTPTYLDQATDAGISANDPLETDNDAPAANTYGFVTVDRNFMILGTPFNTVGGTDYDHIVLFSKVGSPDNYRPINLTTYLKGRRGPIRAITNSGASVLLSKDGAKVEWGFDVNPHLLYGDGAALERSLLRGCINHRTLANVEGMVFYMDRLGIYLYAGGTRFLKISQKLEKVWGRINWAVKERFFATWDDDFVYFAVALDDDTECHWVFAMDLQAFHAQQEYRWYPFYYDFEMRDGQRWNMGGSAEAEAYGLAHKTVAVVITRSGHVFALNCGYRDGVSYELTATGTATGASLSTTRLDDSTATFTATNGNSDTVDVRGCYIRFPSNPALPGAYLITATPAATQLTIETMPATPSIGDAYIIGAIDYVIETPRSNFGTPDLKKPGATMLIEFEPRAVTFDVKAEFEADGFAPQQMAETQAETEYSATVGESWLDVHMGGDYVVGGRKGIAVIPCGLKGFHTLKARLRALGVDMPAQFNGLTVTPLSPSNQEM